MRATGDSYYLLPALEPGDAIEFGADYVSGGGRKTQSRWFGFVLRVLAEAGDQPGRLILRESDSGKDAHRKGLEYLQSQKKKATPEPSVA